MNELIPGLLGAVSAAFLALLLAWMVPSTFLRIAAPIAAGMSAVSWSISSSRLFNEWELMAAGTIGGILIVCTEEIETGFQAAAVIFLATALGVAISASEYALAICSFTFAVVVLRLPN